MNIDERVEPLVRQALEGAVKSDENRLDAALKAFPDEATRLAGLRLALAICGAVVLDLYKGQPSGEQRRALAEKVAEMEGWASLTAVDVDTFLTALLAGSPLEEAMDPESVVPLTFIITGSLLSAAPQAEDRYWFNYLDHVEAAIEAAP
jgi:hypothetical protein